jgi:hypothetical protein
MCPVGEKEPGTAGDSIPGNLTNATPLPVPMATHRPRKRSLHLVEVKLGRPMLRPGLVESVAGHAYAFAAARLRRSANPTSASRMSTPAKATHRTSAEMRMSWNKVPLEAGGVAAT